MAFIIPLIDVQTWRQKNIFITFWLRICQPLEALTGVIFENLELTVPNIDIVNFFQKKGSCPQRTCEAVRHEANSKKPVMQNMGKF